MNPARLEEVLEDALLSGKAAIGDFERIFDRILGARLAGAGRLRALVEARGSDAPGVDISYLQRQLERVLSDPRVPPWTREHPMTINGAPARVDVFTPSWRLVPEADGRRWHARQEDFERDRARDNALATQGIQVLRFTYTMLRQHPEQCLETILQTGAHRSANRRA